MNPVQRLIVLTTVAGTATLFTACSRHPAVDDLAASAAPKIQGSQIVFPSNAPQVGNLKTELAHQPERVNAALNGRLAWNEDATQRVYPPLSGRILDILVQPGQAVKAGDVLARIKSPEFSQAQAEARKASADLQAATRSLTRVRELAQHGAAATKDLEGAETDYARATAEKERAVATLAHYSGMSGSGETTDLAPIRSNVDGVVVEKNVNPGQEIRAEQVGDRPLFVVTDPSTLWVILDATQQELAVLRTGVEIQLKNPSLPDQEFSARVEVISEFIDPNSRSIKVRGRVDNSQRQLKAEMFVNAQLPVGLPPGVSVPAAAVFLKGERHFVFVETARGAYQLQEVDVGPEFTGQVLVMNGLKPGQNVVTDGGLMLNQMLADHVSERQ